MKKNHTDIPARWLLRADSRIHVGAGHVARCHALGHALYEALGRRADIHVILDAGSESWEQKFSQIGLLPQYCRSLEEIPETGPPWDGIIIDGYDYSQSYFDRIAKMTPVLVVIDDFLSPPACATLALNPTPGLKGNRIDTVPALMGETFALIDPAYRNVKAHVACEFVRNVVISCGMSDPIRSNELLIKALNLLYPEHPILSVTVAVGGRVPHLPDLQGLAQRIDLPVAVRTDVNDMIALYSAADLVIGAGGVSLLERMACGLPSASIIIAENQRAAITGAAEAGATLSLGEARDRTPASLAEALTPLLKDRSLRSRIALQSRKTIDGRGADRVAAALLDLADQRSMLKAAPGKASQ